MKEEYVMKLIEELLPDEKKMPRGVIYERLKIRVQQDLSKALSSLYTDGKITYHRTINSIIIEPK